VKEALQQKAIGWTMVAGLILAVSSFGLAWMFGLSGFVSGTYNREPGTNRITDAGTLNLVPLMIFGMAAGVLMMIGALAYGFWIVRNEKTGPRDVVSHFRILARYAYDGPLMIHEEYEIESARKPKFYVRGQFPSGETVEFETSEEVYRTAGEGMVGEAEVQGKWLGRFVGYVGAPIR
jgi:hypothetical protein